MRLTLCWMTLLVSPLAFAAASPTKPTRTCGDGLSGLARHLEEEHALQPSDRYATLIAACGEAETVALTKALVAFKTVSADAATAGPELEKMAAYLRDWSKAQGFTFGTVGKNDVFELRWGEGPVKLAFVFHGDVVPAPAHEWKHDPFAAVVENGNLIGRGVEDDKGPLASALVALAAAKEAGLTPDGQVVVIVGNGEENDWAPMIEYAKSAPKMENVVSVDSEFPIVVAQSGFVAWTLEAKAGLAPTPKDRKLTIVDATAGEFLTQVPGEASMRLFTAGLDAKLALKKVNAAIAALKKTRKPFDADARVDGEDVLVTTHGKAVHASVADEGHNALWDLAAIAKRLKVRDNGFAQLLHVVSERFDGDVHGQKLGVFYEDPFMGRLIVTPDVLRFDKEKGTITLRTNMRRPRGKDEKAFGALLDAATKEIATDTGGVVTEPANTRHVGNPFDANTEGPLSKTLLEIFAKESGKTGKPRSIRGGTYARLFDGAVDFGPGFPDEPYTGHAPDESIPVRNLVQVNRMLANVLLELALHTTATH